MTIVVNGIEITDRAINAELQYHPAPSLEPARTAAARALVVRELLLEAEEHLGISEVEPAADPKTGRRATPEEAWIHAVIEREVRMPKPDGETLRRCHDNNRQLFRAED